MPVYCRQCNITIQLNPGSSNAYECAVSVFVCLSDAIHTTTVRTTVRNAPACEARTVCTCMLSRTLHTSSLPPACRTILKGSCIVCVFCAPRSGTRVWTCSLISGLLCIFSLLKKQHITSAAPMMIVSFSPSTHPTRILSVFGTYPPYQNGFVLCV